MDGKEAHRRDAPAAALDEEACLETLRARYARLCAERDRLRDARGFFSRPLGPAPASAGISTALVATLAPKPGGVFWTLALVSLGVLVLVGLLSDGVPA